MALAPVWNVLESTKVYGNTHFPTAMRLASHVTLMNIAKASAIYQLFDQAVANLLALETHRHGTSILSYPRIFFFGGKIARGGTGGQSAHLLQAQGSNPYRDRSVGRIWMWEDSLSTFRRRATLSDKFSEFAWQNMQGPFHYSMFANKALFNDFEIGQFLALLTPTIKYRFTSDEAGRRLSRDFVGTHGCRYAQQDISPIHLGITGSLIQGVNRDLLNRIRAKPEKLIVGMVELAAAVALTYIFFNLKTSSSLCNRIISSLHNVDLSCHSHADLFNPKKLSVALSLLTIQNLTP